MRHLALSLVSYPQKFLAQGRLLSVREPLRRVVPQPLGLRQAALFQQPSSGERTHVYATLLPPRSAALVAAFKLSPARVFAVHEVTSWFVWIFPASAYMG